MFEQISPRYDLMNRLMSAGQDLQWRKLALQAARLQAGHTLLDVAAGTGDIAYLAQAMVPNVKVVAADFAIEMMRVGQGRTDHVRENTLGSPPPAWTGADTYALPFPSQAFDAVTSAFLLRNLTDPLAALVEQVRVLKPGGRLVMLDATPPADNLLRPFINLYLHHFLPLLGGLVAGNLQAYRYLPNSIANFMRPAAIEELFQKAGLRNVYHRAFMFDTAAIVVGEKGND